ncbi:MAG: succinylglutamate desuccinylase/aspartoacylase family protein [Bacteroidota bacterium]
MKKTYAHKDIIINKKKVEPGQEELIKFNIARLPSGTIINLQAHVYRSEQPGPCMLVLGGVHGDEINGVEIVRRAIETEWFSQLQCGSVIAIPLLNIYGFINFSRDAAEGKDVNRSFPGNRRGSLASRVAYTVTKEILPLIDFGVDFHTGGSSRYNYPQIRFSIGDPQAEELARLFAAPYLIRKASLANSLRRIAMDKGKPIIVYEGGESLRYDGFSITKGLAGLQRLLQVHEMIPGTPAEPERMVMINKTSWVRAAQAGLFIWTQQSGARVSKGEPLGYLNDPHGSAEIPVLASRDGYIIGHNNAPVVSAGDALFHIGYKTEAID